MTLYPKTRLYYPVANYFAFAERRDVEELDDGYWSLPLQKNAFAGYQIPRDFTKLPSNMGRYFFSALRKFAYVIVKYDNST